MSIKTIIKKTDIATGMAKSYQVGDVKIVVCNIDGKYYAVEDVCSHDGGELVSGEGCVVNDCQLECPRHGATFDITTGAAKKMPAVAPIETFTVVEKDEDIEIEVEE